MHGLARHPDLVVRSVRAAFANGRSGRRAESAVTSEMRHNGTGMERVVDATWECVFPDGDCFKEHAHMEAIPENMDACSNETNINATVINVTIDLQCAGLSHLIDCRMLDGKLFDPFKRCNVDSGMLKATCGMTCIQDKPSQVCVYEFDTSRAYNMSDETIEICTMDASCKSPYVEQNHMLCSGKKTAAGFKPHWLQGEQPWSQRLSHDLAGPSKRMQEPAAPAPLPDHHRMLWEAVLLLALSALVVALARWTALSDPEVWKEFVEWVRPKPMRRHHIGAKPYRAPPLTGKVWRTRPQAGCEMEESTGFSFSR